MEHSRRGGGVPTIHRRRRVGTKKKKTKPPSIKSFFPTLKNSQGFGQHLCRYEEKIGDHVYEPKNYGQFSKHIKSEFCIWCKLKPCITLEHHQSIQDVLFDEHWAHDKAKDAGKKVRSATPVHRAERYMVKLMGNYFGREYAKKVGVPNCCMRKAWDFQREWNEIKKREEEEEREAEEEDAGSSSDEEERTEQKINQNEEEDDDDEEENEFL
jgi:hypothetical protein